MMGVSVTGRLRHGNKEVLDTGTMVVVMRHVGMTALLRLILKTLVKTSATCFAHPLSTLPAIVSSVRKSAHTLMFAAAISGEAAILVMSLLGWKPFYTPPHYLRILTMDRWSSHLSYCS